MAASARATVVIWESHTFIGGGQRISLTVAEALAATAEVVFLVPGHGALTARLDALGIEYYETGSTETLLGARSPRWKIGSLGGLIRSSLRGIGAIRRIRPTIIYAPGPKALLQSAVCGALLRLPVCWHVHHYFTSEGVARLLRLVSRWSSVRRVIAVSRSAGERVVAANARHKLEVLCNPVDCVRFDGERVESSALSDALAELTTHEIVLGQVAAIENVKNQMVCLQVAEELLAMGRDTVLVLVGGLKGKEGEGYLASLLERIEGGPLHGKAHYLGERDDVERILPYLTFLLVPSLEGCPLAALEANASGVPVVAIDRAGTTELFADGMAGALFEPDEPRQAAQRINDLCDSPSDYRDLCESGRIFALGHSEVQYKRRVSQTVLGAAGRRP